MLSDELKDRLASFKPAEWTPRPEVLLSANTVKPMHGVVPRLILGKEWWDETRQAAYASTDYHCVACGVSKFKAREFQHLEGHELYKVNYKRGRQVYVETVPLCHYCHSYVHDGRLRAMWQRGEIPQQKVKAVEEHGKIVLRLAGLRKKSHYTGKVAPWGKWRLVLFGKEYPPVFRTESEWADHYRVDGFYHGDAT